MARTIPDMMHETKYTGKELTFTYDSVVYDFTPEGVIALITAMQGGGVTSVNGEDGDVTLTAADVNAVSLPETPAIYSETASDIAAVLVSAGLMAENGA